MEYGKAKNSVYFELLHKGKSHQKATSKTED